MKAYRAIFPLEAICRVLWVSPAVGIRTGCSARPRRGRGATRSSGAGRILAKWIESEKIYGCSRIHAALRDEGERVRSLCAEVPGGTGEPRPLSDDWWRILATPFSTAA